MADAGERKGKVCVDWARELKCSVPHTKRADSRRVVRDHSKVIEVCPRRVHPEVDDGAGGHQIGDSTCRLPHQTLTSHLSINLEIKVATHLGYSGS